MANAASEIAAANHPGITTKPAQLTKGAAAILSSDAAFDAGKASFAAGDLAGARSQLTSVVSALAGAGLQHCPKYTRARSGISRIDRLTSLIRQANAAAAKCNMLDIQRFQTRFAGIINPAAKPVMPNLNAAAQRCAAANQRCIDAFGPASYVQSSAADGIEGCGCRPPAKMNAEGNRCVSPEEIKAIGNQACRDRYGPGAYADYPAGSYKTYVCRCGDNTRMSCARKKRCIATDLFWSDFRRNATASCRAKYGKRLKSVKLKQPCKFTCIYKKRVPRVRRQPPPRGHDRTLSIVMGSGGGITIGIGRGRSRPRGQGRRRPGCPCPHHKPRTSGTGCHC
jgi:hypothetical protein